MTLDFKNVTYRYPGKDDDAVFGVTFPVPANGIKALIGQNGSGKSTLLLLAAGLIAPRSGEIPVRLDSPLSGRNAKRGRRIAFLPQIERLSFALTSLEYVLLGRAPGIALLAQPGPDDLRAAEFALAEVGVMYLANRPVDAISGGELQLVRIARCLAQEPELLVFDEPTSMLDPANTARIAETMIALKGSGRTILFSTHDIGLAALCADTFAIISGGTILFNGEREGALDPEILERAFGVPFVNRTMVTSLF